MLKKLRNRLLMLNMIALAAVVVVSFSVIFIILYYEARGADADRLSAIPTGVITNAMLSEQSGAATADETAEAGDAEGGKKPFIDNSGPDLPIDYSNFFVVNLNDNGTLSIFSRMDLDEKDYLDAAEAVVKDGVAGTGDIRFAGSHWLYSYSTKAVVGGRTVGEAMFNNAVYGGASMVFLNVDDTDKAMNRLLISMIIIGGCVLAGLFLISLAFSNRALRPTEESLLRQRQFVADASHELKTPLAIIDANAEAAMNERIAPGARMWIERIEDESGRMRGLIDNLLLLARSEDAADIAVENLPVDLSSAAEREIDRVEAVMFERGIGVEFQSPEGGGIAVNADPERVRQILLILLDNAMKYTDEGGRVAVQVGRSRKYGHVKISNTGDGIDADDLAHIFDRFYRADKSRTSGFSGGYGLGLSIARAIAERSGGNVTAESADGLTTFTVELPLA
ncbi:MAG: HAMP domain-containing histidine kinase [Clostridiales Family XIII bacterium]|jgi:signal transduction histidine kinase|nr:HAMP domain-containing histidine kinase [Clostridiales Family XIII bacterium]